MRPQLSLSAHEKFVAIAVENLIEKVGKEALHIYGEANREFLEMLSLYAIYRAAGMFAEGDAYSKLVKITYETFDPAAMSENLRNYLLEALESTQ